MIYVSLGESFSLIIFQQSGHVFSIFCLESELVETDMQMNPFLSNQYNRFEKGLKLFSSDSSLMQWIMCSVFSHLDSNGTLYKNGNKKSTG